MEWIKLRTLRSTGWGFGILAVSMVGFAVLVNRPAVGPLEPHVGRRPGHPSTRPTQAFTGLTLGQLVMGMLGVLMITSEFSSG